MVEVPWCVECSCLKDKTDRTWAVGGEMEPTSREELNPLKKFRSMKDRVTVPSEELKAADHNMEATYRGQIEDHQEEIQKKEQLVGQMEPTSREELNPPKKFRSMKDRYTYLYKELKARDRKMEKMYQEQIEDLQDRVKELENKLKEKDSELKCERMKKLALVAVTGAVVAAWWWFSS